MEHLRELRERKKLYQKDVSAALGIDRTTYAKYETGDTEPSFEILKRIARFYDVSIDYLLDFDIQCQKTKKKPPIQLTAEEERLISSFRQFNQKGKDRVLEEVYLMETAGIYKNGCDNASMDSQGGRA